MDEENENDEETGNDSELNAQFYFNFILAE